MNNSNMTWEMFELRIDALIDMLQTVTEEVEDIKEEIQDAKEDQ